MAVRDRSTKIAYTNEVNIDGVATQKELTNTIADHITNYHTNTNAGFIVEDGMEFFYDTLTNKWLSTDWYSMNFFSTSTSSKNAYMSTVSAIPSNYVPIFLPFNYDFIISKIQVDMYSAASGILFNIERDDGVTLTVFNQAPAAKNSVKENLDVIVPKRRGVRVYINSVSLNRPVVTIWCRLIRP